MSWFCVAGAASPGGVGTAGIVCVSVRSVVGAAGAGELEEAEFTSLRFGAGTKLASLKRTPAYSPYQSWNCFLV